MPSSLEPARGGPRRRIETETRGRSFKTMRPRIKMTDRVRRHMPVMRVSARDFMDFGVARFVLCGDRPS
jgi:hypothetical protein